MVQTAAYADRLAILQVSLHEAVRSLSRATALSRSSATAAAAHDRVMGVLGDFVGAWEALVALQEKLDEVNGVVACFLVSTKSSRWCIHVSTHAISSVVVLIANFLVV